MDPIPALESIPLWNQFHAIPIPVLLIAIPTPVPIPEKNGIITPLVVSIQNGYPVFNFKSVSKVHDGDSMPFMSVLCLFFRRSSGGGGSAASPGRTYVDNSLNRRLGRVGMALGSMPVSRDSGNSSLASPRKVQMLKVISFSGALYFTLFIPGLRGQRGQPQAWKSRNAPRVDGSVSEPQENR